MQIFVVLGYGIPVSIETDENYLTYLRVAFNRIFDEAKDEPTLIIPCGGATSCTPPYDGTEAEMMGDYIKKLIDRPAMGIKCSQWSIQLEAQSLSTLENLVFAKVIIDQAGSAESITMFCEETRSDRIRKVGEAIFSGTIPLVVEPIDFDISENRYLPSEIIEKREQAEIEGSLWALESHDRLIKHHELFERKFTLLRSLQDAGMSHVDAMTEWYRRAPALVSELMPDHPALQRQEDEKVVGDRR